MHPKLRSPPTIMNLYNTVADESIANIRGHDQDNVQSRRQCVEQVSYFSHRAGAGYGTVISRAAGQSTDYCRRPVFAFY